MAIVTVPGDPLQVFAVTESVRFVIKGGQYYRHEDGSWCPDPGMREHRAG